MHERRVRALQFVALQVVGAVAVVHLAVGTEQLASVAASGLLAEYLSGRVLERPRGPLFVVSGLAVLVGLVAAGRGWLDRRTAYQLGIVAMVAFLGGWVAWHTVLDHGFALSGEAATTEHSHGGLLATIYSHYVEPLLAAVGAATTAGGSARTLLGIVSVTLELVALALLVVLLRVDPAAREGGLDLRLGFDAPEP
jgi:hypothetical protein